MLNEQELKTLGVNTDLVGVNEELLFAEKLNEIKPILDILSQLVDAGRLSLKNQQFRLDSNRQVILAMEKQITQNRELLKDVDKQAQGIIKAAQAQAAEIEKGVRARIAETNHLNREAKKTLEEAEKTKFSSRDKVTA